MTATWTLQPKPGTTLAGGWLFNEPQLLFNSVDDPNGNDQVMFNGLGATVSWTNQLKS